MDRGVDKSNCELASWGREDAKRYPKLNRDETARKWGQCGGNIFH